MKPHGTVGRYTRQRCRCPECTAANSAYQRARRTYKIVEFEPAAWSPVKGCLPVQCWCQADVVKVSVEDIRAGRTASCGQPDCRPEMAWVR
jgi:hypothetical protein